VAWNDPSEKNLQENILKYLRKVPDSFVYKIHGSKYGISGLPDICFVWQGKPYYFEVKAPGGKLTAQQAQRIEELHAAGAIVAVVSSAKEVRGIIEPKRRR